MPGTMCGLSPLANRRPPTAVEEAVERLNAQGEPIGPLQVGLNWKAVRPLAIPLLLLSTSLLQSTGASADEPPAVKAQDSPHGSGEAKGRAAKNESLRGRVVFLAEAMKRLHGIKSVREAGPRTLAIESPEGELTVLVEDERGRAFRADPRLLALKDVELLVQRTPGVPAVQIVRLYQWNKGKRFELDYWCEICAIAMFELKPCDCCQGDIELRIRPAAPEAANDAKAEAGN